MDLVSLIENHRNNEVIMSINSKFRLGFTQNIIFRFNRFINNQFMAALEITILFRYCISRVSAMFVYANKSVISRGAIESVPKRLTYLENYHVI